MTLYLFYKMAIVRHIEFSWVVFLRACQSLMKSAISRSWRTLSNFWRILQTLQNRTFFHNLAYISGECDRIFTKILSHMYPWTEHVREVWPAKKASRPYNNIGKHLLLINCNVTFLSCYCECIRTVFAIDICLSVRLSVRPSVKRVDCDKRK